MSTPEKVYRAIKKEMSFDDSAMRLVGITLTKLETAYNHCIAKGLTDAKAEAMLMQIWENSKKGIEDKL